MAKKLIIVRVLVAVSICGIASEPNNLIKAEEGLLKTALDNKEVSPEKADIDYCQNELDVDVVNLADLLKSEATENDNDESSETENNE